MASRLLGLFHRKRLSWVLPFSSEEHSLRLTRQSAWGEWPKGPSPLFCAVARGGLKIRRASRSADFVCAAMHNRRAGRHCARDPPKTHIPHQNPVNKRFSLKFSVRVAFGIPLARHAAAHTSSWVLPFSSESTRCVLGPVLWRQLGVNGSWLLPFTPFFSGQRLVAGRAAFYISRTTGPGPSGRSPSAMSDSSTLEALTRRNLGDERR